MQETTNAIKLLEQENIQYTLHTYPTENGPVAAVDVAAYFGYSLNRLFKTLVTTDHKGSCYVFCLPAEKKMDLKKAAGIVGVNNLKMLKPEIFEELTGYTHGGCSPFGLRTKLPVYVEQSAQSFDTIFVSGGKVGYLIEIEPKVLEDLADAQFAEFTK